MGKEEVGSATDPKQSIKCFHSCIKKPDCLYYSSYIPYSMWVHAHMYMALLFQNLNYLKIVFEKNKT